MFFRTGCGAEGDAKNDVGFDPAYMDGQRYFIDTVHYHHKVHHLCCLSLCYIRGESTYSNIYHNVFLIV